MIISPIYFIANVFQHSGDSVLDLRDLRSVKEDLSNCMGIEIPWTRNEVHCETQGYFRICGAKIEIIDQAKLASNGWFSGELPEDVKRKIRIVMERSCLLIKQEF